MVDRHTQKTIIMLHFAKWGDKEQGERQMWLPKGLSQRTRQC